MDVELRFIFDSDFVPSLHYRSYIKETKNFLFKMIGLFE